VAKRPYRRGRRVAIAFGVWVAIVIGGIVLATVGNLLREPLCLGGGSECAGAKAPSHAVGNFLYYAGTVIALGSPLIVAALYALWHRRGLAGHRLDSPLSAHGGSETV
jgi:hypothetical protein